VKYTIRGRFAERRRSGHRGVVGPLLCAISYPAYASSCSILDKTQSNSPVVTRAEQ
jgi:hypothetical protein